MLKAIIFIFVASIPVFLHAQERETAIAQQFYEIHTYTTKDGLSQVSVNDIVQDDEGFLWIATQSGLNRFDGTSFRTFENPDYDQRNCGKYINVLFPDIDKIWIGSRAKGLCYYDKKAHGFISIEVLQDFDIEDMVMDSFNRLYVTVENKGVAIVEKADGDYRVYFMPWFGNMGVTATAVFISKKGVLWVGTSEGRLFYGKIKSNPEEIIFNEFPLSQKLEKIYILNSNGGDRLWAGTQNNLFRIDLLNEKVNRVTFDNAADNSPVIYELKWKGDILWIGTGTGLYEYDMKGDSLIKRYVHSDDQVTSISNNVVYSILLDKNDQLWAGTGKYLNLFYKNEIFYKIQNKPELKGSLNSNVVFSILKDNKDLWVGTSGGGINLIRGRKRFTFTKNTHNLPSNICFSLLGDKGSIWAGTREGLVIIKNCSSEYKTMRTQNVFHSAKDVTSLSADFIRYIYKDSDENIWLCTSGGGLNLFTGDVSENEYVFRHYRHNPNNKNSIASDQVNYILQTGKNKYWIATDKGLSIMTFNDKKSNNADFSRLMINDSVVLDKPVVYTLLKDKEGGIWIGTTGGIYYLKNKSLQYFSVKEGLPDNVIYAILEDFQGNIWISTNKGLSRFDREAETFTNYHQADGLSSEEYDLHAKFIDKNGILYFGGIDGITYFNPGKLPSVKPANKLYIDNIQITNIDENSVETVYLENNQRLSVKQKQFPVTINFSDINLKYYKNTTFAYRLLPDNTRWNMIKDKRFIQLMNLSPDDYTLEIQEVGKDNRLGGDRLLRIPITVVPLWWQSKFAYWAYVFLIMFVVYRIFRFSLKRKIEHQENLKLKELNNIKSRLYTNITHEFRTPLTVIKGMTGEMRYSLTYDEQKHCDDKLEMIERNSDKLLHLVKQMLDMSKIEEGKMKLDLIQDDIVSYLQYVLESFQSMADSRNIKLVFYHETDKVVMDYDQDKIFMIASNLLSNAIKFTPGGGKVIFHVKREQDKENDNLVIKVQDSGIGIEEEHLQQIFDRFYQIDNSSTRQGEGTGIGLALTKELVEMMKGEIIVKSIPGESTEFRVTIPVTNNAKLQKNKPVETKQTEPENGTVELVIEEEKENGLPLALIVEDNPDVAKYIISCLKGKYRVKWSPDGGQGIDAAIAFIPDIIISDVMMPVKDGFEVCETLKQDERTSHIPIVMLTAKATDNDRIEGLSHGADAYLTKPFNKQELFVRLEQLIKIRKQLQEKYSRVEISITEKAEPSVEEKFLIKVIGIIEKNIDNSKLDSEMLAEGLSLSESQLYRKVKAVSGKSVSRFIREIRLSAAKKLIETTTLNISQIAYQCGFNDPAWFSRIFKKEFGESPGKFRKS